MKYLLVFAVVLIGWFVWRQRRAGERTDRGERSAPRSSASPSGSASAAQPLAMVRCPVCALHLPESDAVPGRQGRYCSDAHRAQAEG